LLVFFLLRYSEPLVFVDESLVTQLLDVDISISNTKQLLSLAEETSNALELQLKAEEDSQRELITLCKESVKQALPHFTSSSPLSPHDVVALLQKEIVKLQDVAKIKVQPCIDKKTLEFANKCKHKKGRTFSRSTFLLFVCAFVYLLFVRCVSTGYLGPLVSLFEVESVQMSHVLSHFLPLDVHVVESRECEAYRFIDHERTKANGAFATQKVLSLGKLDPLSSSPLSASSSVSTTTASLSLNGSDDGKFPPFDKETPGKPCYIQQLLCPRLPPAASSSSKSASASDKRLPQEEKLASIASVVTYSKPKNSDPLPFDLFFCRPSSVTLQLLHVVRARVAGLTVAVTDTLACLRVSDELHVDVLSLEDGLFISKAGFDSGV